MFSSHPLFRIFRVVLLFSYQVSLTSYQVFAVHSLVRQRDIYYHTVKSLSTTFFSNPEVFFSERAARISPRRRSGNLSRPLLAVNRFLLLFSKNLFAPPCPASRPCPAQRDIPSRSGENGLCTSTPPLSTTFYFLSDFFAPRSPFLPCFRSG